MDDTVMAHFDQRPGGMTATMTQYYPEAKRWRPVTYRSREFEDIGSRYSQPTKEAKAVEWGTFANQTYLYGMTDVLRLQNSLLL